MIRRLPAAGSYAPVTILIQELPGGGTQSDLGLAAVGERQWPEPEDCLRCFAALIWRDRMLVSLERTAVEFLKVRAGQALIGSLTGQAGRYSKKVQQPVRT